MTYIKERVNEINKIVLAKLCLTFEGMEKVKKDGLVYPYYCPAGFPTQGVGRRIKDIHNSAITKEQALDWLIEDMRIHLTASKNLCPGLKNESHGAIADFSYNLGATRLAGSTLRRKLNKGDYEGAKSELLKWVRGGGKILPGLVIRRKTEAQYLGENK